MARESIQDELQTLSRRERQIMDAIFALGKASVNQVWEAIADAPSRTAVRTMFRILEEKGHLSHTQQGREFIYRPTQPRDTVGRSALNRVLDTFYNGSLADALAAQLFNDTDPLNDDQLEKLGKLIQDAKHQGR